MVNNLKIYNNFNLGRKDKDSIILIGNFDGLHKGHQKLFNKAKNFKKKFKLRIGVITFDPIPKMFFKKLHNYRLSNFDQKIQLLKKNHVDFIVNQKFNIRFSKISSLIICFLTSFFISNPVSPSLIHLQDSLFPAFFEATSTRSATIKLE